MLQEPPVKRAVAFFDGQNLYRHAKEAFGHHHPNYDPIKLFDAVCAARQWQGHGVRFYTGTPAANNSPMWHGYWSNRLLAMRRAGILVTSRPIRYRREEIELPDGTVRIVETPQEKGIDLRIGLDVVRMARNGQLDVAVIFSQDQDFAEIGKEVRDISNNQEVWLKVVSAFPSGPTASVDRGIDKTDWFEIDETLYNSCLDPRDYRPRK